MKNTAIQLIRKIWIMIPLCLATSLFAQETESEETKEEEATQEESKIYETFVVTGSRAKPRSVTESMVPIDVIGVEDFVSMGETDIHNQLRTLVPSYNVNAQPISDAATIVRPANLRGLAPDHSLVLINGKRRHRAAVIYWLGNGVADGAQGPDISTIPSIALRQVEVLRDGASAQYGSDAIAGVMNFMLNEARDGSTVEVKYGSTYEGDGTATTISGNFGLPLTDNGFANLSFEFGNTDPTDRSVQRDDAAGLIAAGNTHVADPAQVWGSPDISDDLKLWGNFGFDLSGGNRVYAQANYASKTVTGGFYFRNPNTRSGVFSGDGGDTLLVGDMVDARDGVLDGSGDCPVINVVNGVPDPVALAEVLANDDCFTFQEIFPGGFTPQFGGDVVDYSLLAGVKGITAGGMAWDASIGTGLNEVDFFISNTVNASLGPDTPTTFDPGLYGQEELSINFDIAYPVNENLNFAAGAEYRDETFEIGIGQLESYEIGPLAAQGFSAASNGFPGFGDIAAGNWSRSNYAVYADMEYNTDRGNVGVAVRFEDFEDFGTTTNGKVAGNYHFTDNFLMRGSASTGFRAPTPGQSNAFNVSTEFDLEIMELVNNGTIPTTSAVAQFVGAAPLTAEESVNLTLGTVFQNGPFTLTVDYFNIALDDRITVSQNFQLSEEDVAQLVSEGVTSAANLANFRFFTNDFDTETTGIDVVATYNPGGADGRTNYSLVFNHTETEVKRFNPETLDATRIRELQEGLPENRWNASVNHRFGDSFRLLGRVNFYDGWFDSEDGESYDGEYIVDMEAAYNVNQSLAIMVGAQNLLDTFPTENPGARSGVGNRYSQFTPFGFNGGMYYARIKYDF